MALSKLNSLYMALVAEHSKSPHHKGVIEGAEAVLLNNPTCGDLISLTLSFDGDVIKDIAFLGDGCSISTASASMMTDAVIGKTKAEALKLAALFQRWFKEKKIRIKNCWVKQNFFQECQNFHSGLSVQL